MQKGTRHLDIDIEEWQTFLETQWLESEGIKKSVPRNNQMTSLPISSSTTTKISCYYIENILSISGDANHANFSSSSPYNIDPEIDPYSIKESSKCKVSLTNAIIEIKILVQY